MYSASELARFIRLQSLEMVHRTNASHIGSALSIADIIAVLYGEVMNFNPKKPNWAERDRFILSKGHACIAVYTSLSACGFFPADLLRDYTSNGSQMMSHISHNIPGVEFSTGSLGHGLPFATGKALSSKISQSSWKVYTLLSDGELDEGSNWEAFMFASHHRLTNLVAIVDYNNLQSLASVADTLALEPLADKLQSFGWAVREVDGHDCQQLKEHLLSAPWDDEKPSLLIARTVKGKGVSFMENDFTWHYRSPNLAELSQAIEEVNNNA